MEEGEPIGEEGTNMTNQPWMYALPAGIGRAIHQYDRYKDLKKMDRDWRKNTGRTYAYPTTGYDAMAYSGPANYLYESAVRGGTKLYKSSRSLMNHE